MPTWAGAALNQAWVGVVAPWLLASLLSCRLPKFGSGCTSMCGYEYVSILHTKYGVRAHQSVLQYSSTPYHTSYSERIGSVGLTIYVDEVRQTSQHNPPGEQTGAPLSLVSWMPSFIYIPRASRQSHVFTHFPVNNPGRALRRYVQVPLAQPDLEVPDCRLSGGRVVHSDFFFFFAHSHPSAWSGLLFF